MTIKIGNNILIIKTENNKTNYIIFFKDNIYLVSLPTCFSRKNYLKKFIIYIVIKKTINSGINKIKTILNFIYNILFNLKLY